MEAGSRLWTTAENQEGNCEGLMGKLGILWVTVLTAGNRANSANSQ
jgi:hypothetical protein